MGILDDDLFSKCANLIKKWKLKESYDNELEYRNDLANFLAKNLNKRDNYFFNNKTIKVKKEAGDGRSDIGIYSSNNKICIELKKNIKHKSDINRLQGQITDYYTEFNYIIVVVINENLDSVDINRIKYDIQKVKSNNNIYDGSTHLKLIVKSVKKRRKIKTKIDVNKNKKTTKGKNKNKNSIISTSIFKLTNKGRSDWFKSSNSRKTKSDWLNLRSNNKKSDWFKSNNKKKKSDWF